MTAFVSFSMGDLPGMFNRPGDVVWFKWIIYGVAGVDYTLLIDDGNRFINIV